MKKSEYANSWSVSSKFFYKENYYRWMEEKISEKAIVLEIGCGVGYSTLTLLENGHKVIAVDKNQFCLDMAKELVINKGYIISESLDDFGTSDVVFLKRDVVSEEFNSEILSTLTYDAVVCWNVGGAWNSTTLSFYSQYLLNYGLTPQQIQQNPESSYAELILWNACKLAKKKGAIVHIVERSGEILNEENDTYYNLLKSECGFSRIEFECLKAKTVSEGGTILVTDGIVNREKIIDIILASIVMG